MSLRYGLTLNKGDWNNLIPEIAKTKEWQMVKLGSLGAATVPQKPGVYVVCTSVPFPEIKKPNLWDPNQIFANIYAPMYAGKSINLKERFTQHVKGSEQVKPIRECYAGSADFWFIELPENMLHAAEGQLIQALGPPANKQAVSIPMTLRPGVPA